MEVSFDESYLPRSRGWWVLAVSFAMLPVFIYFVGLIDLPVPVSVLCVAVPFVLSVAYSVSLIRCRGCLRWRVSGDVIAYDSPADLLAGSFQIPLSEADHVHWDHDADSASLFTIDGREHPFHVGHISGVRFYEFLRERLASTKTVESTGTSTAR